MTTPPLPRVLVLFGGPDSERTVSLESGHAVADALERSQSFDVLRWDLKRPSIDGAPVNECDCIFPVLHGPWGEGGPLQRLLEQTGVPFVGSQQDAARLAMDKMQCKHVMQNARINGFQSPSAAVVGRDDECTIEFPVVVKPNDEGSSVGVRICHTASELRTARRELHELYPRLMVEQYIEGREVTVGVVLGEPLPLLEIIPELHFYDYQAKYERDDTSYRLAPDDIDDAVQQQCRSVARSVFETVGCRDVARADFICATHADGTTIPWFLEINTMPGFTSHSLLPMAARESGLDMPDLCKTLVNAALTRVNATQTTT